MHARRLAFGLLLARVVTTAAPGVTCGACHERQARSQAETSMAHALSLPGADPLFQTHPRLAFRRGRFSYAVERRGETAIYTVTDGSSTLSLPVGWVFGARSRTYVIEYRSRFYESLVSYYDLIDGLDVTVGDEQVQPRTLVEAMGRELTAHETLTCFQCHSSGAVKEDQLQLPSLSPGVQCEHCHEGAGAHLEAMSQGKRAAAPRRLGDLTAEDISNFCGRCHRSWAEVVRNRSFGTINVRFQPYRLANSKCYDGSDARIGCIACHDPHRELVRDDRSYDGKCLACHSRLKPCGAAKTTDCVSCHMPKVRLPGGHQVFTDHFIRVVRAGEPYPD